MGDGIPLAELQDSTKCSIFCHQASTIQFCVAHRTTFSICMNSYPCQSLPLLFCRFKCSKLLDLPRDFAEVLEHKGLHAVHKRAVPSFNPKSSSASCLTNMASRASRLKAPISASPDGINVELSRHPAQSESVKLTQDALLSALRTGTRSKSGIIACKNDQDQSTSPGSRVCRASAFVAYVSAVDA